MSSQAQTKAAISKDLKELQVDGFYTRAEYGVPSATVAHSGKGGEIKSIQAESGPPLPLMPLW